MSDSIAPSVLADVIEGEFDEFQVEVGDGGSVIITDSFAAGFYHPEDFEAFERSVREFVLQYTECWKVMDTSSNQLEGYHRAVLQEQ